MRGAVPLKARKWLSSSLDGRLVGIVHIRRTPFRRIMITFFQANFLNGHVLDTIEDLKHRVVDSLASKDKDIWKFVTIILVDRWEEVVNSVGDYLINM